VPADIYHRLQDTFERGLSGGQKRFGLRLVLFDICGDARRLVHYCPSQENAYLQQGLEVSGRAALFCRRNWRAALKFGIDSRC
jgi:hypothetical protein